MAQRAGVPVTMGSLACIEALRCYPAARRVGILTPYQPVGDAHVRRFFEESGYAVAAVHSLKQPSEVQIAHASEARIQAALDTLAAAGVDAIVQAGTDLAVADLAEGAERRLAIPVLPINTATYWSALRRAGISDRREGFGSLFAQH
jgi:maleate isomerase